MDFTAEELSYIATHIFLPPKLPHKEERDRRNKDSALSRFILSVADEFKSHLNQSGDRDNKKSDQTWKTICRMLKATHFLHGSSHLDKEQVNNALKEMEINDVIPIYIAAQNAAVVFRKPSKEHLTFEFFEVSLPNNVITSTAGKVVVQYPANSRLLVNNDENVLSTVSNILSFLNSTAETKGFTPKTSKRHDTASPSYISEALAGFLRAIAPAPLGPISTTYIQKRIDDQALGSSKFERLAQVLESLAFKRLGKALGSSEFGDLEQTLHASELEDLVKVLKSSEFKQKGNVFWPSDFESLKQILGPSELLRLTQINAETFGSSEFESLREVLTPSEYEHLKSVLGFLELRRLKQNFRSSRFGPLKAALESSEFVRLAQVLGSTEFERLEQALAPPEFERLAKLFGSSHLERLEQILGSSGFKRLRQALESSDFEGLKEAPGPSRFERFRHALESGLEKFKRTLELDPERSKKQAPAPSGLGLLRDALTTWSFEYLEQAIGPSEFERLEQVLGSSELERLEQTLRSSGFKRLGHALSSSEFESLKQSLGSSELLRWAQLLGPSEFERLKQVLGPSDFERLKQVLGSSEIEHLEQIFHSPESRHPTKAPESSEFQRLKQVLESSEFGNVERIFGSPRFEQLNDHLQGIYINALHSSVSEGLKKALQSSEFESLKQVLEASEFERLTDVLRSSQFESLEDLLQSSGLGKLVLSPSEFQRLEQILRSSKPNQLEQDLRALESESLKRVLKFQRFQHWAPIFQSSEMELLKPVLQSSGFESLEQLLLFSEYWQLEGVIRYPLFQHLEQVYWSSEFESLGQAVGPTEFEHLKRPLESSGFIGFSQIPLFSGFYHLKQTLQSSELEQRGRSFRPSELEGLKRALGTSDFKRLEQVLQFSEFRRWGKVLPFSTYKPWRRSPMWLVLRVAIQSTLCEAGMEDEDGYKAFQVFAMSKLLDQVVSKNEAVVSSDIVYLMNAKLARRLVKLKELVETKTSHPINTARETVHRVASLLDQRWQETQKSCMSPLDWAAPSLGEIDKSFQFSLKNSNSYLRDVMERTQAFSASPSVYSEARKSRELVHACSDRLSHHSPELPRTINTDEPGIGIYDLEVWVERQLPLWSQRLNHTKNDYETLATILDTYSTYATSHHKDAPECLSVMYLCILELWVALDKIAIKFIPLLSDYIPEIPSSFLEPLLLPHMSQMRRLYQVEGYLLARHGAAIDGYSAFGDMNHPQSFQNRFFASSSSLKDLKRQIEALGVTKKEATLQTMRRINQKYAGLAQKLGNMPCTVEDDASNGPSSLHKLHCEQCRLREKVRSLGIGPFEELLPQNIHRAQALVFEFNCPSVFSIWRAATYRILRRAISPAPAQHPSRYMVSEYYSDIFNGKDLIKNPEHGLGIVSDIEPPRDIINPPINEKDIIRTHSGQFSLYDFSNSVPLCKTGTNELIRSRCTFQLDGHYQDLQNFISDTSHTSNEVIVARSACPVPLRISEHDAFGHLRSGNRLQWRNIMRALASSSLSFSEPGVYSLIIQSIWQAGPRGEEQVHREAHAELQDTQFGTEIIGELRENLNSLGDNDHKFFFLAILNAIACRLHTLTTSSGVREASLKFLEDSRKLALRWIDLIAKEKLQFNGEKAAECQLRSTRAALVYRSSFDLEDSVFSELFSIPDNLTGFIRTLIIIPFGIISGQPHSYGLQCLLRRDQQLSYRAEFHVAAAINQNPSALDLAVRSVWPAYISGSPWSPLQAPGTRWWITKTKKDEKLRSRAVHLNIIDGTLLVDAKTIGRLPLAYLAHPSYRLLFPSSTLDSRPSTIPEMEYEVDYAGRQIHLLMVGKDLIIRTWGPFGLEEFIPATKLHGDIPLEFEEGRAHWYLEATKEISFRPDTSIWEANPRSHWSMALTKDTSVRGHLSKRTINGIQEVIDPHSIVHKGLARAIHALEPTSLHITTFVTKEDTGHKLHISLSRHNFKFFLNETQQLECQNLPNYIIDKDQVRTSLFGLQDALFLRKQSTRPCDCHGFLLRGC